MFQRTAAGHRVTTRSQVKDENAAATKDVKQFAASKSVSSHTTTGAGAAAAATLATRKRRALGDVSNQVVTGSGQVDHALQKKPVKPTVAVKPGAAAANSRPATHRIKAKKEAPAAAATTTATATTTTTTTQPTTRRARSRASMGAMAADAKALAAAAAHHPQLTTESDKENETGSVAAGVVVAEKKTVPVMEEEAEADHVDTKRARHSELQEAEQPPTAAAEWEDLDADDWEDPMMVSEYVVEIFEYLRVLEVKTMPDANYMSKQKDLQWKMRSILIDWLAEVHTKFKLLPETLFLTINIVDRFLSIRQVTLDKLQLVGITGLFIAAKYEEVYVPGINQFVYITDGCYTNSQIIKAERYMLSVLGFNLQFPNPLNFLRRCSKADDYNVQTRTLAKYFMEAMLLDESFLAQPPSKTAAAGLYMARIMVYFPDVVNSEWNANLAHYSGYTAQELHPLMLELFTLLSKERKFQSIYRKYSVKQVYRCSRYAEDWVKQTGAASFDSMLMDMCEHDDVVQQQQL